MQKVIWITPALALLLLAPAVAQYPSVTVEARRWSPSLTGSAQAGDQTLGTFIDLESDLGLDPDDLLEGRLLVQLSRRNQLRLSYLKGGINGDRVSQRTISGRGQVSSCAIFYPARPLGQPAPGKKETAGLLRDRCRFQLLQKHSR